MVTKYVASCSFGKDSTAMVLRLIEEHKPLNEVIFYDTGMEFDAIYHVRDKLVPIIKSYGAKYTEIKPKEDFLYLMLAKPVESKQKGFHYGYGWCGGRCRWGTTNKKELLDAYTKGCYIYVGIAVDEPERFKRLPNNKLSPLVEWNMTETDCLEYCRNHGISWNEDGIDLYDVLDRVSCWCCCNKNLKELKAMWRYLPKYWQRLKALQIRLNDRPMKNFKSQLYGEYGNVLKMEQIFVYEEFIEQMNI